MQETQVWTLGQEDPCRKKCNPLQYSCLGNPMDRGNWWARVHEVTKSGTWLSDWTCTILSKGLHGNPQVLLPSEDSQSKCGYGSLLNCSFLLSRIKNQTISGSGHSDQHKILTFPFLLSLFKRRYLQIEELQEAPCVTTLWLAILWG